MVVYAVPVSSSRTLSWIPICARSSVMVGVMFTCGGVVRSRVEEGLGGRFRGVLLRGLRRWLTGEAAVEIAGRDLVEDVVGVRVDLDVHAVDVVGPDAGVVRVRTVVRVANELHELRGV